MKISVNALCLLFCQAVEPPENKSTTCGANARLQLLLENSKSKKGHYIVKNVLRDTYPTCKSSPFDSKQPVFQVYIFSNDRIIRKMSKLLHENAAADDNRAMKIP